MMYVQYSNATKCGGSYSRGYQPCEWQITHEADGVVARTYCDDRYEGVSWRFGTRREALEALSELICEEVQ